MAEQSDDETQWSGTPMRDIDNIEDGMRVRCNVVGLQHYAAEAVEDEEAFLLPEPHSSDENAVTVVDVNGSILFLNGSHEIVELFLLLLALWVSRGAGALGFVRHVAASHTLLHRVTSRSVI